MVHCSDWAVIFPAGIKESQRKNWAEAGLLWSIFYNGWFSKNFPFIVIPFTNVPNICYVGGCRWHIQELHTVAHDDASVDKSESWFICKGTLWMYEFRFKGKLGFKPTLNVPYVGGPYKCWTSRPIHLHPESPNEWWLKERFCFQFRNIYEKDHTVFIHWKEQKYFVVKWCTSIVFLFVRMWISKWFSCIFRFSMFQCSKRNWIHQECGFLWKSSEDTAEDCSLWK